MYFNTSPYAEIISGISTIFSFSDGVVKLTGSRGTGKSALLRELANELRGEGMEVVVFDSLPKSAEELQDYLVRKLELPADVGFRKALLRQLHIRPRDRQRLILAIDDAELINVQTLKAISSLRRLENDSQAFVNVLLCGEPALDKVLAHPDLTDFNAEISMQYQLRPLDIAQLGKFSSCYLNFIGKGHYQLSNEHLDLLLRDSGGMPGQIIEHLGEHLTDPSFLLSLNKPDAIAFRPTTHDDMEIAEVSGLENIRTLLADGYKDWLKLLTGAAVTLTIASVLYGTSQYWSRFLIGNTPETAPPAAVFPSPAQPIPPAGENIPAVAETETPTPPAPPAIEAPPEASTPAGPAAIEPAVQAPAVAVEPEAISSPAPAEPAPQQELVAATNTASPSETLTTEVAAISDTALRTSVDLWAAAWQRQDVDAYLAAYHSEFTPQYHNSLSSWRNDRIRNLTRPASIRIDITDFEVVSSDDDSSTVRFWQEYRSPTYADRTQKQLTLSRDDDGQLHILRELNQQIVRLPAAQTEQQGTAAATSADEQESTRTTSSPADDNISQFIDSWLNAWKAQDVTGYLEHYRVNYKPDSAASSEEWRRDRTLKINRPAFIQLQLREMEVVEANGADTLLRLTLEYRSNFYADRTIKLLRVQRSADGELEIIMERNTLVETLPLANVVRRAPLLVRTFGRVVVEQTF